MTILYYLQQFKEFGILFQESRPETTEPTGKKSEIKRESLNTTIPAPHVHRRSGMLNHIGVVWWIIREFLFRKCILESFLTLCNFKAVSQLQNWGMFDISKSSDHDAVDQRSWDCKVNWRAYDISIDCGANRVPWLRYAWCNVCVALQKLLKSQIHFRKE